MKLVQITHYHLW